MSDIQSRTTLGCGEYSVYFTPRGGRSLLCPAENLISLSFNRTLNDFSTATIVAGTSGISSQCCGCLGSLNPWEHEVLIARDGVKVWAGPIISMSDDPNTNQLTFNCRDLFAWFDKRWLELTPDDYEVEDVDITTVTDFLINHAYDKDPWNLSWNLSNTGILITTFYPAYQSPDRWGGTYPNIGEELRALSRSGMDFTVINRQLIGGSIDLAPDYAPMILTNQVWAKLPTIEISGAQMATSVGVAGGHGGYYGWVDDQMWIENTDDSFRSEFGLLEEFYVEDDLDDVYTDETPNAIAQNAYGRRELKKQPYLSTRGGEIASTAPFQINDFIPGRKCDVRLSSNCRDISGEYRLIGVDVSFDGDKGEVVQVDISPMGVEDVLG